MILGIDGSNLRSGGGLRHLVEFLTHATPDIYGFTEVVLWVGPKTEYSLPKNKKWLKIVVVNEFDKGILHRAVWRYLHMKPFVEKHCSVLFSPGGITLFSKIPEVTMSRNMQPFDVKEKQKTGFSKARLRLELLTIIQTKSFKFAKNVIFLNEFAKSTLTKQLSLNGGSVVPHGCSKVFKQQPKFQKEFTPNSVIKILYVSTLNTYKHQIEVIKAITELQKTYKNIQLTLIGDGYKPYQKQVVIELDEANKNGSKIVYTGKVGLNELTSHYHENDIFLYASSCENLPNILLEAMSAGLPIACSNVEPMPSVLKCSGEYFTPSTVSEISVALLALIESPSLREKLANGAYLEAENYSWQRCSNETMAVLQNVANGR